ncbi:MAG: DEAD/DEAH box helicase family protein [Gemmatimonadales bacterium]|nr:DEAD/DEAH box helicase family protein [Gemmatimonadales bacterium]
MTYVPEQDRGESAKGRTILSADMWIPLERFGNPDAIIRMSTLTAISSRDGSETLVQLARREPHHIVMSRHLQEDWEERVPSWEMPDLESSWERVGFGDHIQPRDETQERAWRALLHANNGVLNLACGKGKTVLALKKIAQRNFPAIVIVNNEGLIEQWIESAKKFLGLDDSQIGVVRGTRAQWDRPFVVGMIHTISNRADDLPMEVRQRFGTVVFDEVHHLSASTFLKTAPLFFGARYGLTATLEREDGLEPAYYAHVGEPFYSDLVGELTAQVFFQKTEFALATDAEEITDKAGEFSLGLLHVYLGTLEARNRLIIQMVVEALKAGRKVLALTHSKEQPKILKDMLEKRHPGRWVVGAVSGGTKGRKLDKPEGRRRVETKGKARVRIIRDSDVTFATMGVAREGLDADALDTVLFLTPFQAWGFFQQGKGRIERKREGKKDPIVVVLDDLHIPRAHSLCWALRRNIQKRGYEHANIPPRESPKLVGPIRPV